MRSELLAVLCAIIITVTGCGSGTADQVPLQQATAENEDDTRHCVLLRAGEIEAIIGDGSRIRNHPGIWLLASQFSPYNVAHNKSSMLNGGGLRNREPIIKKLDEFSCVLERSSTPDDPSDIRAIYRIRAPHYLDYEHNIRDTADRIDPSLGYRSVGFANYTNSPDDLRIHFISNGEWLRWTPKEHGGEGSAVAPSYLAVDELEVWPDGHPDPSFWWYKRLDRGFDEPFFYGRFEDMVLIWVFDQPQYLRFFLSPEGGGRSLRDGKTSTAWDFEWVIPQDEWQAGKWYNFRARLILKRFVSDDDVLLEVRRAQQELGFQTVAALDK
jgi:hypothetical protein